MATYTELFDINNEDIALLNRIEVSVWKAVETVFTEVDTTPNHANRLIWAKKSLESPRSQAIAMLPYVLAVNSGATATNIKNASDAAIQTNLESVIDLFADGT